MNAVLSPISTDASLTDLALAYHGAVAAQNALRGTSDELLASAYETIEHAIHTLRTEGTRLDQIAVLEDQAFALASAYERHREVKRDIAERVHATRAAMGYERNLAKQVKALADDTAADTDDEDALVVKLYDVAEILDTEE